MSRKSILFTAICVATALILCVYLFAARFLSANNEFVAKGGSLSLITEPDDGISPALAMIRGASTSVDLAMYELDDPQIEEALVADKERRVAVRVILSGGYKGASSTVNILAYDFLRTAGVPVRWSPTYFSLTHEKSLVADGTRAFIMTFNLVSRYYATGRDFGIIDTDRRDVAAIEHTFDADWRVSSGGEKINDDSGNNGDAGDDLLWSPGSEPALIDLIRSAKRSLFIYNEEMADMNVTKALIDAARRGVAVYVDMTNSSEWKWQFAELVTAGAHVRTYADADSAPLYIHAKMIVADAARAFVGSENFSETSLNENRELGIMISDPRIIAPLIRTFVSDWRGAAPFAP